MAHDDGGGTRRVTIALSRLAYEALLGESADSEPEASARMDSALRLYLRDREAARPAWRYPGFLRGSETQPDAEIELEVAEDLWLGFEDEAAAQGVSVEQLAEHAAFYFGAELAAGRLTVRILDDLEPTKDDAKS